MPLAKLKSKLKASVNAFAEFKQSQSFSGFLLLACTIIALVAANSPWHDIYHYLLHVHFAIHLGDWGMNMQLESWVNDGLMAVFFLLVGLEIKRELLIGELSSRQKAILPIVAAAGGMLVPALIFTAFNWQHPEFHAGWGIPMATDIAFALGVLSLLGNRIPRSLFVLLAAIAIADDLGAVLVIAIFYTNTLHWNYLAVAFLVFALLLLLNCLRVKKLTPYLLLGIALWYCILNSGIHATIAGVLLAAAIPCRLQGESPLQRLEHDLHTPVNFIIIPIFVLFNAGVTLSAYHLQAALFSPLAYGIVFGLIIGKCIGLFGSAWLLNKFRLAKLPDGISFKQLFALSLLGGIGFTMAIFISNLAFPGDDYAINIAKLGIFVASIIAAVLGYGLMHLASRKSQA
jgi:NhaA family Na+:H+ antiporter